MIKLKNVFPFVKQIHFVDVEQPNIKLFDDILHWKKFDKKIEFLFDKIKSLRRRLPKNRYLKVEKTTSTPEISTEVTQKVVEKPTSSAEIWRSFSQPSTFTSPLYKNDFDSSSDEEEPIANITSSPIITRTNHKQSYKTINQQHPCKIEDFTEINRPVRSEISSSIEPSISLRHESILKPSNTNMQIIDPSTTTSIIQHPHDVDNIITTTKHQDHTETCKQEHNQSTSTMMIYLLYKIKM